MATGPDSQQRPKHRSNVSVTVEEPEELHHTVEELSRVDKNPHEIENHYRLLFENMLEGCAYCRMMYDKQGHPTDFVYLSVNNAFNRIIGTKTVVGKPVTEVFPGIKKAFPVLFEIYGRVALTGQPESFDIDFKPLEKWLHISVYSTAKEYFVAVFEDITARKKAETDLVQKNVKLNNLNEALAATHKELRQKIKKLTDTEKALRESESRYRTVFESTGTAMVIIEEGNGVSTLRFANKEFYRLTGYSPEDIESMRSWTEFIFKDDLEKMIEENRLRLQKQSLKQYEFRLITKSGDIRNILLTVDMLPGTTTSVGSLIDITESKESEAVMEQYSLEVTRYAEALTQSNDKLNLLNSITRHDILNQLTAILGYLELMKMSYPDSSLQEFVNKEFQAAQNIKTQIMFTKDYQEIGIQSPQWFDLKKVILANAEILPLSTVKLIAHFDNLEIYADPMFEKVLYTLLENGLRHGQTVTTIEFSCVSGAEGLKVTYQDNGEGIPAEYKEAIFQRKFFKHTGFGLFLSRTILGITGMTIRENGEPGKGAKFEIMVPEGAYRFTSIE